MSRCGIVILAAGGSTRMGEPKQSLVLQGSTLLDRAVSTAMASVCRPIVVVLGAGAEKLKPTLEHLPVTVVINPDWQRGMGTSIRQGISAMGAQPVEAAMIFLCDQPLITAAALNQMVEKHFELNANITAAFYGRAHGTPVLFSTCLFSELAALKDDEGGKTILKRHSTQIQTFALAEAEADIDTQQDLQLVRLSLNSLDTE